MYLRQLEEKHLLENSAIKLLKVLGIHHWHALLYLYKSTSCGFFRCYTLTGKVSQAFYFSFISVFLFFLVSIFLSLLVILWQLLSLQLHSTSCQETPCVCGSGMSVCVLTHICYCSL